jgi:hypothetical protein
MSARAEVFGPDIVCLPAKALGVLILRVRNERYRIQYGPGREKGCGVAGKGASVIRVEAENEL